MPLPGSRVLRQTLCAGGRGNGRAAIKRLLGRGSGRLPGAPQWAVGV